MTNPTLPKSFAFSAGGSIELDAGSGSLTVESAEDRISFMQSFDITRDQQGLDLAVSLASVLAQAIDAMQADQAKGALPKKLELTGLTVKPNPLA